MHSSPIWKSLKEVTPVAVVDSASAVPNVVEVHVGELYFRMIKAEGVAPASISPATNVNAGLYEVNPVTPLFVSVQ